MCRTLMVAMCVSALCGSAALLAITPVGIANSGPPAPPPGGPPNVPGPPPGGATDVQAPLVRALPAAGHRGRQMKLRFTVSDDSGYARLTVLVYRGSERLARFPYDMQAFSAAETYYTTWAVRRAGRYRFCVIGVDPSGHKSSNCAPFSVT
jgi:hypothetical protein